MAGKEIHSLLVWMKAVNFTLMMMMMMIYSSF